jgi:hydrogenase/urease accessory protein HupE
LSASIALMLLGNINLFSISLADFPYYNISISIVLLGVILILRMKVKERLTYIDYSIWGIFSFVLGLWGIKGAF